MGETGSEPGGLGGVGQVRSREADREDDPRGSWRAHLENGLLRPRSPSRQVGTESSLRVAGRRGRGEVPKKSLPRLRLPGPRLPAPRPPPAGHVGDRRRVPAIWAEAGERLGCGNPALGGAAWVGPAGVWGVAAATPPRRPRGLPDSRLPWPSLPSPPASCPRPVSPGGGARGAAGGAAGGLRGGSRACSGAGSRAAATAAARSAGARPGTRLLNRLGGGARAGGPAPRRRFRFLFPGWRRALATETVFPPSAGPAGGRSSAPTSPGTCPSVPSSRALAPPPSLRVPCPTPPKT